ncbi:MAG: YkgJ family cysteine cluster protein [Euryarchaeota archaeon]|nr:YkgJ family cysteine cluster protein [Euryarchaeota archaeon]
MTGSMLPMAAEPVPCVEERCPAPCCDLHEVPLLDADIERLVGATSLPAESFVEASDGWRLLRGAGVADDGCVFKGDVGDGKGCTVHKARPAACRTYPLVLADDGHARRDEHCPHTHAFVAPPEIGADLRALQARLESERGRRVEETAR